MPQRIRAESTAIRARANGTASRNGRLPTDTRSAPQTLIHASGLLRYRFEQQLKRPLLETLGGLDAAHVVDDEGHVDSCEQLLLRHDVLGIEMQHDVPAQRLDSRQQPVEHVEVRHAAQVLDEIEAYAANAAVVQALQFPVGYRIVNAGHAAIGAVTGGDGIQGDLPFPCRGSLHAR